MFNHKKKEYILEVLEEEPIDEKLSRFKSNWLQHVVRINTSYVDKGGYAVTQLVEAMCCKPEGRGFGSRWVIGIFY